MDINDMSINTGFFYILVMISCSSYAGYSNILGSISEPLTRAASLVSGSTDASILLIPSVNTGTIRGHRINCNSRSAQTTYTTIIWVKSTMKINGVTHTISNISSPSSTVIKEVDGFRITYRGYVINNPDTCTSPGSLYLMAAMDTPNVFIGINRLLMMPGTNTVEITFAGVFGELRSDYVIPSVDNILTLVKDTWKTSQVTFNFADPGCMLTPPSVSLDHGVLNTLSIPGNTREKSISITCINNAMVKAVIRPVTPWVNNIPGRIHLGDSWYSQLGFVGTNSANNIEWTSNKRENQHIIKLSSMLGGIGKSGVLNGNALLELQYE